MTITPEPYGLTALPIPVPLSLEKALGYSGKNRYLALWWEPAGDEAVWDDGQTSTDACWQAFLAYVHHPVVEPALRPYDLGSSDGPGQHRLLLDLIERRTYIGTTAEVSRFLHAAVPLPSVSLETLNDLLAQLHRELAEPIREASRQTPSLEEVWRHMVPRHQALQDLVKELDKLAKTISTGGD